MISVDYILHMSSLTTPVTGINERPNEGLGQEYNVEADISANVDTSSEEGEIKEDQPSESRRKRSTSNEEQPPPKRNISTSNEEQPPSKRLNPGNMIKSFSNMRAPRERLPCVVSVNENQPFGSLYKANQGFANLLFLDPGRYGPPTILLSSRTSGTQNGKDMVRICWDTNSNIRGQWALTHFEHGHPDPKDANLRRSNPTVLAQCDREDMRGLMYIRFTAWPQSLGFYAKEAFVNEASVIRSSLKSMFRRRDTYVVEIWFIASFKPADFQKDCLRCFSDSIACRDDPLHRWSDDRGVLHNDLLKLDLPPVLGGVGNCGPLRMPQNTGKVGLPEPNVTQGQHIGTSEGAVTGSGDVDHPAERLATEPSLASQHLGDVAPAEAQDANMLDHPPSPPTETRYAQATQEMLTFREPSQADRPKAGFPAAADTMRLVNFNPFGMPPESLPSFPSFNPFPNAGVREPDDDDKRTLALLKLAKEEEASRVRTPMDGLSMGSDGRLIWSDEPYESSPSAKHM